MPGGVFALLNIPKNKDPLFFMHVNSRHAKIELGLEAVLFNVNEPLGSFGIRRINNFIYIHSKSDGNCELLQIDE